MIALAHHSHYDPLNDDVSELYLMDCMPERYDDDISYWDNHERTGETISLPDSRILRAARISTGYTSSFLKTWEQDKKLIHYLLKNKHMSCFEHNVLTFEVKLPIFVARQWMRHYSWNFNEKSLRYTTENIEFYYPKQWRLQGLTNRQAGNEPVENNQEWHDKLLEHNANCLRIYTKMINAGISNEQARFVLPVNVYTTFIATVNLRNLFYFLLERDSPSAQFEIQQYARIIRKEILPDYCPLVMSVWEDLQK